MLILSGSRAELEKRHPLTKLKWARRALPRPRMIEAYLFFHDQLSEFFLGTGTRASASARQAPLAARLEECFQALKSSLQVVTIDLQPDDDSQVIFETLNIAASRCCRLTCYEIISSCALARMLARTRRRSMMNSGSASTIPSGGKR